MKSALPCFLAINGGSSGIKFAAYEAGETQTGDKGVYLKQQLKDKLIAHKQYIDPYGEDLQEIRNWKWGATNAGKPAQTVQAPERMFTWRSTPNEPEAEPAPSRLANANVPAAAPFHGAFLGQHPAGAHDVFVRGQRVVVVSRVRGCG